MRIKRILPLKLTMKLTFKLGELKMLKTLRISAITLALASSLMASTAAIAMEDGKLIIWINGDKGYDGLQALGDKFSEELGVEVIVEHPEAVTDKFQQAAASGQGPDIFFWAHDRFGEWATAGLIAPVEPSQKVRDNTFDFAWDSVTFGGKTWGYPVAVEAVGLIYNKDLIATPPETMEEILTMKIDGVASPIMWDYNNTYFSMPLLMAGGGFAFEKINGDYDATKTGVNNAGSIAGASIIKELIDKGVMPSGVDYGVMDAAINKGETAMVINGPWAWSNLDTSGINYGVAPIPSVNGQKAKSFVGVLSAAINAGSPNNDLAVEFLENYVLTDKGLKTINDNVALGAVASKSFSKVIAGDARIAATLANAENGIPMPSIPAMGKFWAAMEPALKSITGGQSSVEDALNGAATRILSE